jgi:cytochrome c-type biogenesis protein CcmH
MVLAPGHAKSRPSSSASSCRNVGSARITKLVGGGGGCCCGCGCGCGLSPAVAGNAPASAGAMAKPESDGTERLSGRVVLAPELAAQVSPTDTVFIYANAAEGPRMPLAIIRTTVDKLPYDFVLDDSLAMNPQMKLSQVKSVMVRARISKTGNAMPQAGDFGASVGPVTPGSSEKLQLTIAKALTH